MTIAFRIHARDTVATLLDDGTGQVVLRGEGEACGNGQTIVALTGPIAAGHKVALQAIPAGAPIIKFGIVIGTASVAIACGDWVHLHNCASAFDERSGGFDVVTGAAGDMRYD